MYFKDGALLTSNDGDSPGRFGDSCFHTMAFALSWFWTSKGHEYHPLVDHTNFFDSGCRTVRHKLAPWQHEDMSEDNEKPLFMFLRETGNDQTARLIYDALRANGWRTGNNKMITLGYVAELRGDWVWLRCLTQLIQVIFMWFPFYWNDGAWNNFLLNMKLNWNTLTWRDWFNWMLWKFWSRLWDNFPVQNAWKKTDGYLQWLLTAHKTPFPFRRLIRKKTLRAKISEWYRPEWNRADVDDTELILSTHFKLVDLL
jgi:hypothetical protein